MILTQSPQGLIFDVDGTMLDSMTTQYNWFKHLVERFGSTKPFPENNTAFWQGYNAAYEQKGMLGLYEFVGIDFATHREEIWGSYSRYNQEHQPLVFPGVRDAIQEIHRRSRVTPERRTALRLAINTTKPWNSLSPDLHSLLPLFDTTVTKDDAYDYCFDGVARTKNVAFDDYKTLKTLLPEDVVNQLEKPNSLCSRLAVERLGVEPGAIIAFEDTTVGVKAYKSVLMPKRRVDICVVGVTWGYQQAEELRKAGADIILDDPEDLVTLVDSLGGLDQA